MKRPRLNKTDILFIAEALRLREKLAHDNYANVERLFDRGKELKKKMQTEGHPVLKEYLAVKEAYLRERKRQMDYANEGVLSGCLARRFEGLANDRRIRFHMEP